MFNTKVRCHSSVSVVTVITRRDRHNLPINRETAEIENRNKAKTHNNKTEDRKKSNRTISIKLNQVKKTPSHTITNNANNNKNNQKS